MGGAAAGNTAEVLVDVEEDVCRLCFSADIPVFRGSLHPNQVDPETGLFRLEEISWKDLAENGFSLQRKKLYSLNDGLAEAKRRDDERAAKGKQAAYKLAGVLIAKVAGIHAISDDDGRRTFRVLQTPTEKQPAHAEIRIADHCKKQDLLKYRQALQTALGRMEPAEALDAD